jgi:hypothetical protein
MDQPEITRRVLIAGGASAVLLPAAALAQVPDTASLDELRRLLLRPGAIEQLLRRMDFLCWVAVVSLAKRRNELPPPDALVEYYRKRALFQGSQRPDFIAAVQGASDGAAKRAEEFTKGVVRDFVPRLQSVLVEEGLQRDSPLLTDLLRSFVTFVQLISVGLASDDRWWCRCYGLSVLC